MAVPHRLHPMADDVRRVPDDEVDGEEGWERLIDDDVRGVEAIKVGDGEWPWQVILAVAEFVREDHSRPSSVDAWQRRCERYPASRTSRRRIVRCGS